MTRLTELLATFVINASWQIVVVCAVAYVCSLLLKRAQAKYRHFIWLLALLSSVLLPVTSIINQVELRFNPVNSDARQLPYHSENTGRVGYPVPTTSQPANPGDSSPSPVIKTIWQQRLQQLTASNKITYALAILFALFSFYFLIRLVLSWRQTQKLRRSVYEPEISASLLELIDHDRAALRARRPQLVCSEVVEVPLTVGTLKPLIILPGDFYERQSIETLRTIIGHEIAHIARQDFAINLLCQVLLIPVSFHPLTRLIKRQIDRTRELSCDELVTAGLIKPESHARSLVQAADQLAIPRDQAFMLGVFDADILEERIMTLTQTSKRLTRRSGRLLTVAATLLFCLSTLTVSTFSFSLETKSVSPQQVAPAEKSNDQVQEQSRLAAIRVQTERSLRAPSAQERAQAACDAGKRRSLASIPQLISMLGDDSKIEPINCWSNSNWSPALDKFKSPSPGEQAAIALASIGRTAFAPLTEALGNSNSSVRRNAAWAIGELTNMLPGERSQAVPALTSLLNDSEAWTRAAAARALGELRDTRSTDRLIIALSDSNANVRQLSAWALGEMKYEGAVEQLCNVLENDIEVEVRLEVANALGEIRSQKAVASLNKALSDSEASVREKVRWALSEIEDVDS